MPDWKEFVRERFQVPELKGLRRERLIEEVAVQLADVEREALERGLSAEAAAAQAAGHITDWDEFSHRLTAAEYPNRLPASSRWFESTTLQLDYRGGPARILAEMIRTVGRTLRSIRFEPGFWAVTVGILALGIGATTTIFSVVNGVLLKKLPYDDPAEVITLQEPSFSMPRYQDYLEHLTSYEILTGRWDREVDWTGNDRTLQLGASLVLPGFLELFGATAETGRLFVEDDFHGAPHRAVLSYSAWVRHFGADPGVVGRTMFLDGQIAEVVGIVAAGFTSPDELVNQDQDLWLAMDPNWEEVQTPDIWMLELYGRLRDGVSPIAAQREIDEVILRLAEIHPDLHLNSEGELLSVTVQSLQTVLTGDVRGTLVILMGAVTLLLLIGCTNVANLFLARGTTRFHDVAVHAAMGAGRGQIVLQLLTESAVFAVAGGLLGCVLAMVGVRTFTLLYPGDIPLMEHVAVDLPVLIFTLGLSLLTGLLFGALPALRTARLDLAGLLREGVQGAAGPGRSRLRSVLVVAEIALALILLAGAGLLFNSYIRLTAVEPGFDVHRLAGIELNLGSERFDSAHRQEFVNRLLSRIESLPGVEQAAVSMTIPFQSFGEGRSGWRSGALQNDAGREILESILTQPVTDGYFTALGARLTGEAFTPENRDTDPLPVVLSKPLADMIYPDGDALNRTCRGLNQGEDAQDLRIVGVVSGLHHWGLDQGDEPVLYVPWERTATWLPFAALVVRTRNDPEALLPLLRDVVWDLDPEMVLSNIFTLTDRLSESLVSPRFYSALLLAFASVALLLAAGGIYGSMLYTVRQRHREIGIRTALGADRSRLVRLIVTASARITALGLVVGLAGAFFLTRLLQSMLFGVSGNDPVTFAVVAVIMGAVAIGASLIPAWRAAATDPVEVLRVK